MPKNLLQDMVRIKSSIKQPIEKVMPKIMPKLEPFIKPLSPLLEISSPHVSFPEKKHGHGKRYSLWFVALISVVFFLFALSFLISGVKITINPKVKEVALNKSLSAAQDANDNNLPFDLVVISGEENKTIQTTEEKDVALQAKGIVVFYNAFSIATQQLAIDTRLEGTNGKIYKTQTPVVVPGINKDGTPGSVEMSIYASEAGEQYNSGPLDFTILGFKGTPKYAKFKVRSKTGTENIGGFKGKVGVISPLEKMKVDKELQSTLQAKLLKKATGQIPDGFILFKDAVFLQLDDENVNPVSSPDKMMPINVKGTLYGFLLDEKKLTKKIAEDVIEKYDGSEVYMPNIRGLTFSLSNKENTSFADVKNISFNLTGPLKIIWKVDEDKFLTGILGKKKAAFNQMLSQYPNIDSAVLSSPFWIRSLPDNKKDIKVIVNYPK